MVTRVSARGSPTQCGVCMSKGCCCSLGSAAGHLLAWVLLLTLVFMAVCSCKSAPMNCCTGLAPHQRGPVGQPIICAFWLALRQLRADQAGGTAR